MPGLVSLALFLWFLLQASVKAASNSLVLDLQPRIQYQLDPVLIAQLRQQYVTVSGADVSSVWDAQGRVFQVQLSSGSTLTLQNLTLSNAFVLPPPYPLPALFELASADSNVSLANVRVQTACSTVSAYIMQMHTSPPAGTGAHTTDNTSFITFAAISQPGLSATRLTLVCDPAFAPASDLMLVNNGVQLHSYLKAVDALQLTADIQMLEDISLRGMPGVTWPLDSITLRSNVTISGAPTSHAVNSTSTNFALKPVAGQSGDDSNISRGISHGASGSSLSPMPGSSPGGLNATRVLDLAMSPDLIMLRTRIPLVLQDLTIINSCAGDWGPDNDLFAHLQIPLAASLPAIIYDRSKRQLVLVHVGLVVSMSELRWLLYWMLLAQAVQVWPNAGLGPLESDSGPLPPWFSPVSLGAITSDSVLVTELLSPAWSWTNVTLISEQSSAAARGVAVMPAQSCYKDQVTDAAHPPTHAMFLVTSSDNLTLYLASLSALTSHSPPSNITPQVSAALQAAGINASLPVHLQPNMPAILALSAPSFTYPVNLAPMLTGTSEHAANATGTQSTYSIGRHTIVVSTPRSNDAANDSCQGAALNAGDRTCTVLDLSGVPNILELGQPSPGSSSTRPVVYFTQVTLQGLFKRPFADMADVVGPPPHQMNLSAGTALPIWAISDTRSKARTRTCIVLTSVTLVLPPRDFGCLLSAAQRGPAWAVDVDTLNSIILKGITMVNFAAYTNTSVTMSAFQGWGISGADVLVLLSGSLDELAYEWTPDVDGASGNGSTLTNLEMALVICLVAGCVVCLLWCGMRGLRLTKTWLDKRASKARVATRAAIVAAKEASFALVSVRTQGSRHSPVSHGSPSTDATLAIASGNNSKYRSVMSTHNNSVAGRQTPGLDSDVEKGGGASPGAAASPHRPFSHSGALSMGLDTLPLTTTSSGISPTKLAPQQSMPKHFLHQTSMQAPVQAPPVAPLQPTRSLGIVNLLTTVFSRVSNYSSPGSNRASGSTRAGGRSSAGTGAGTTHPSNLISEDRVTTGTDYSTRTTDARTTRNMRSNSGGQLSVMLGRKSQNQVEGSQHAGGSTAAGTPPHVSQQQQSGSQSPLRASRGAPPLGHPSANESTEGIQDLLPTGGNLQLPPIVGQVQQQSRLLPAISLGSSSVEGGTPNQSQQSAVGGDGQLLLPTARTSSGTAQQPSSRAPGLRVSFALDARQVKEQEDAGGSGYGPRHPRVPAASTSGAQGHKSSLGGVARMGSANAAMQSAMQQASSSVMGAGLPSSYYPGGPASVTPSRIGIGGPPVPSRRTRQRHRVPPQRESLFGLLVTASKLHNMEGLPGEDGGMLMPSAAYQDPLAAAAQWGSVTMYGRSGAPAYVDDEAYGGASGPAAPGLKPREEWDPNREVSRLMESLSTSGGAVSGLQVLEPIGVGGFGTVYRGKWRGLEVAIKVVSFKNTEDDDEGSADTAAQQKKRAVMEAAVCASIVHDNVVATYAHEIVRPSAQRPASGGVESSSTAGQLSATGTLGRQSTEADEDDWKLYLVQEYCNGSLQDALRCCMLHQKEGDQRPIMDLVLSVLMDVARGMAYIHTKNVIHGDLTPGNVLLKQDAASPTGVVAKVTDFGLCTRMEAGQESVTNFNNGTPFYVAPEVIASGVATKASDVYTFGVLMWEMYRRMPPWIKTDTGYIANARFRKFPTDAPKDYVMLCARCLSRFPKERPPFDAILAELQAMHEAVLAGRWDQDDVEEEEEGEDEEEEESSEQEEEEEEAQEEGEGNVDEQAGSQHVQAGKGDTEQQQQQQQVQQQSEIQAQAEVEEECAAPAPMQAVGTGALAGEQQGTALGSPAGTSPGVGNKLPASPFQQNQQAAEGEGSRRGASLAAQLLSAASGSGIGSGRGRPQSPARGRAVMTGLSGAPSLGSVGSDKASRLENLQKSIIGSRRLQQQQQQGGGGAAGAGSTEPPS